jgi:tripartite-type tricarboxylate transporter receptor subunit TctC
MKMMKASSAVLAALSALLTTGAAQAEWPTDKPIKMIVPFPAGGGTDFAGRLVAQHLGTRLKANIIVENRAGANGQVGLRAVKEAAPDGYTLGTASDGPLIYNHGLYKERLPYDTLKDFAPVGMIMKLPAMLVVHPSVPVKSVQELIKLAKEKPGELNYSSPGYGNFGHIATEFFMKGAGIKMTHVPTTGTAPAVQAVVQGAVQVHINNLQSLLPQAQGGHVRGLGVAELTRVKNAPDLPPIAETIPGFDMAAWTAVIAPAGTPPSIVKRLSDELVQILKDPEVVALLEKQTTVPWPMPSEELGKYMAEQIPKWTKIIDEAGIQLKQ